MKIKNYIYLLKDNRIQFCVGIFLILLSFTLNAKADDSIYYKSNNIIGKNNDFKIILSDNVTSDLIIDNSSIYFFTKSNFYSVNKTNGNIVYKVQISGIKEIKQTNNYTYLKTNNQIYKINKTSGTIEQKQLFGYVIDKIYSFFGINTLSGELQTIINNNTYYINTTNNNTFFQYDNDTLNLKLNKTDFNNQNIFVNQTFTNKTISKVLAYPSTGQDNIPSDVHTQVTLSTESYDTNNDFASSTFTAPRNGYYLVIGQISYVNYFANKHFGAIIYKNAGVVIRNDFSSSSDITNVITVKAVEVLHLNQGETIKLYAWQIDGAGTTDIVSDSGSLTYLNVVELN